MLSGKEWEFGLEEEQRREGRREENEGKTRQYSEVIIAPENKAPLLQLLVVCAAAIIAPLSSSGL